MHDQASADLDAKIKSFVAATEGITAPDKSLLMQHFNDKDLKALWKRLEKARGHQPDSVQQAWDDLKKLGSGAPAARNKTLALFLIGKGDESPPMWVDHLITASEEISRIEQQQVPTKPLYRGELEAIHGKAEAARHIRMGKWKQTFEKDGEPVYLKVSAEKMNIDRHSRSITGTRRRWLMFTLE